MDDDFVQEAVDHNQRQQWPIDQETGQMQYYGAHQLGPTEAYALFIPSSVIRDGGTTFTDFVETGLDAKDIKTAYAMYWPVLIQFWWRVIQVLAETWALRSGGADGDGDGDDGDGDGDDDGDGDGGGGGGRRRRNKRGKKGKGRRQQGGGAGGGGGSADAQARDGVLNMKPFEVKYELVRGDPNRISTGVAQRKLAANKEHFEAMLKSGQYSAAEVRILRRRMFEETKAMVLKFEIEKERAGRPTIIGIRVWLLINNTRYTPEMIMQEVISSNREVAEAAERQRALANAKAAARGGGGGGGGGGAGGGAGNGSSDRPIEAPTETFMRYREVTGPAMLSNLANMYRFMNRSATSDITNSQFGTSASTLAFGDVFNVLWAFTSRSTNFEYAIVEQTILSKYIRKATAAEIGGISQMRVSSAVVDGGAGAGASNGNAPVLSRQRINAAEPPMMFTFPRPQDVYSVLFTQLTVEIMCSRRLPQAQNEAWANLINGGDGAGNLTELKSLRDTIRTMQRIGEPVSEADLGALRQLEVEEAHNNSEKRQTFIEEVRSVYGRLRRSLPDLRSGVMLPKDIEQQLAEGVDERYVLMRFAYNMVAKEFNPETTTTSRDRDLTEADVIAAIFGVRPTRIVELQRTQRKYLEVIQAENKAVFSDIEQRASAERERFDTLELLELALCIAENETLFASSPERRHRFNCMEASCALFARVRERMKKSDLYAYDEAGFYKIVGESFAARRNAAVGLPAGPDVDPLHGVLDVGELRAVYAAMIEIGPMPRFAHERDEILADGSRNHVVTLNHPLLHAYRRAPRYDAATAGNVLAASIAEAKANGDAARVKELMADAAVEIKSATIARLFQTFAYTDPRTASRCRQIAASGESPPMMLMPSDSIDVEFVINDTDADGNAVELHFPPGARPTYADVRAAIRTDVRRGRIELERRVRAEMDEANRMKRARHINNQRLLIEQLRDARRSGDNLGTVPNRIRKYAKEHRLYREHLPRLHVFDPTLNSSGQMCIIEAQQAAAYMKLSHNNILPWIVAMISHYDTSRLKYDMHFHSIDMGEAEQGKTFRADKLEECRIPGTMQKLTRQTLMANTFQGEMNGLVTYFDELPKSLVSPDDGGGGGGGGGNAGNSDAVNMNKQLLTSSITRTKAFVWNPVRKTRDQTTVVGHMIMNMMASTNAGLSMIEPAMRTRFNIMTVGKKNDQMGITANDKRLADGSVVGSGTSNDDKATQRVVQQRTRLRQALIQELDHMFAINAMHEPTEQAANVFMLELFNQMVAQGMRVPSPRWLARCMILARILCIIDAIDNTFFMPAAPYVGQRIRFRNLLDTERHLVIGVQHVVFAVTLTSDQLISRDEAPVHFALKEIFNEDSRTGALRLREIVVMDKKMKMSASTNGAAGGVLGGGGGDSKKMSRNLTILEDIEQQKRNKDAAADDDDSDDEAPRSAAAAAAGIARNKKRERELEGRAPSSSSSRNAPQAESAGTNNKQTDGNYMRFEMDRRGNVPRELIKRIYKCIERSERFQTTPAESVIETILMTMLTDSEVEVLSYRLSTADEIQSLLGVDPERYRDMLQWDLVMVSINEQDAPRKHRRVAIVDSRFYNLLIGYVVENRSFAGSLERCIQAVLNRRHQHTERLVTGNVDPIDASVLQTLRVGPLWKLRAGVDQNDPKAMARDANWYIESDAVEVKRIHDSLPLLTIPVFNFHGFATHVILTGRPKGIGERDRLNSYYEEDTSCIDLMRESQRAPLLAFDASLASYGAFCRNTQLGITSYPVTERDLNRARRTPLTHAKKMIISPLAARNSEPNPAFGGSETVAIGITVPPESIVPPLVDPNTSYFFGRPIADIRQFMIPFSDVKLEEIERGFRNIPFGGGGGGGGDCDDDDEVFKFVDDEDVFDENVGKVQRTSSSSSSSSSSAAASNSGYSSTDDDGAMNDANMALDAVFGDASYQRGGGGGGVAGLVSSLQDLESTTILGLYDGSLSASSSSSSSSALMAVAPSSSSNNGVSRTEVSDYMMAQENVRIKKMRTWINLQRKCIEIQKAKLLSDRDYIDYVLNRDKPASSSLIQYDATTADVDIFSIVSDAPSSSSALVAVEPEDSSMIMMADAVDDDKVDVDFNEKHFMVPQSGVMVPHWEVMGISKERYKMIAYHPLQVMARNNMFDTGHQTIQYPEGVPNLKTRKDQYSQASAHGSQSDQYIREHSMSTLISTDPLNLQINRQYSRDAFFEAMDEATVYHMNKAKNGARRADAKDARQANNAPPLPPPPSLHPTLSRSYSGGGGDSDRSTDAALTANAETAAAAALTQSAKRIQRSLFDLSNSGPNYDDYDSDSDAGERNNGGGGGGADFTKHAKKRKQKDAKRRKKAAVVPLTL